MIRAAADAGADFVKFQSYKAEQVTNEEERDWYGKVQIPDDTHFELVDCAADEGVKFLSTPFTVERAQFLVEEVGLSKIKVASSEMLNRPLLEYLNGTVDSVFLSTGLSTLSEVKQSVEILSDVNDVCVMQCTSEYPCPPSNANLNVIRTYAETFPDHSLGFSDHTLGLIAAQTAVTLGADVIEEHFTTHKSLPGPDQQLSMTPAELRELRARIEKVETLLGNREKKPTEAEQAAKEDFRSRFNSASD
jgi:sialic acid synthase SpsE